MAIGVGLVVGQERQVEASCPMLWRTTGKAKYHQISCTSSGMPRMISTYRVTMP